MSNFIDRKLTRIILLSVQVDALIIQRCDVDICGFLAGGRDLPRSSTVLLLLILLIAIFNCFLIRGIFLIIIGVLAFGCVAIAASVIVIDQSDLLLVLPLIILH